MWVEMWFGVSFVGFCFVVLDNKAMFWMSLPIRLRELEKQDRERNTVCILEKKCLL